MSDTERRKPKQRNRERDKCDEKRFEPITERIERVIVHDVVRTNTIASDAADANTNPKQDEPREAPEPVPHEGKRAAYADIIHAVARGESLEEAARRHGMAANIISKDPTMHKLLSRLFYSFSLPADVRRELVRARLNQILIEGDDKAALAAARQIAEDPQVGLRGGSTQSVNIGIFSPEVTALIERIPLAQESKKPVSVKIPKSITSDSEVIEAGNAENQEQNESTANNQTKQAGDAGSKSSGAR